MNNPASSMRFALVDVIADLPLTGNPLAASGPAAVPVAGSSVIPIVGLKNRA